MEDLKFLSHTLKTLFPYVFEDSNEHPVGMADYDLMTVKLSAYDSTGIKRPFTTLLVGWFHEFFHIIDDCTGYKIFTDDDEDIKKTKEASLDAFCQILLHVLIENNLLNPAVLKRWKQKVERV